MDQAAKIDANVTAPVLARWLGVSGKVIYDLAKAGIIERASGGQLHPPHPAADSQ
jgi:hypothetical protein